MGTGTSLEFYILQKLLLKSKRVKGVLCMTLKVSAIPTSSVRICPRVNKKGNS